MVNLLRALLGRVGARQGQESGVRGERQGYKGKLGTRAMEASVGGAEGRISEDDLSKENPPADMQREKGMEHPPPPRDC